MEVGELQSIALRLRTARLDSGVHLVDAAGELDLYSAPALLDTVERLFEGGARTLVLDLTRTSFMDSTGAGVLVASTKLMRSGGGELYIVAPHRAIASVLDMTGLRAFLSVVPKVSDALPHA